LLPIRFPIPAAGINKCILKLGVRSWELGESFR
jgi:hypothetical protein